MKQVQMLKSSLVGVMKHNRDGHRANFEDALRGFQKTAIKKLNSMVAEASSGLQQSLYVSLACPEDHTKDYDRVLSMLDAEVQDTVILTQQEFAQYVQDDWAWKQQWTTSNSAYLGMS